MSRLTSAEEIAIVEAAAGVITSQKQTIADLLAAAAPAAEENAELKAALEKAESEDAASDAALASLASLFAPAEALTGVDPIDPPADAAVEEPATGSENPATPE